MPARCPHSYWVSRVPLCVLSEVEILCDPCAALLVCSPPCLIARAPWGGDLSWRSHFLGLHSLYLPATLRFSLS